MTAAISLDRLPARTQMSGLRLDDRGAALKGGAAGPVIVPGKSAESKLIRMVAGLEDKKAAARSQGEKT